MHFKAPEENSSRRRRTSTDDDEENEEAPPPVPQFGLTTNIGGIFELNSDIEITSPEPIHEFDLAGIKLYLTNDTLKTGLEYTITQDSLRFRTYRMAYNWKPGTGYTLEIDSAAFTNIYGITSSNMSQVFNTRDEDYYGRVILKFSDVKSPIIAQLLLTDGKETVLSSKSISTSEMVTFDYLAPGKYIVKIIYDDNNNGKWDPGSFQDKLQPERVSYHNEVIRVRSNWDNEINWAIDENPEFIKKITDAEQ